MGELKATGSTGMYRLYYGEPDQAADIAVGLCVRLKRTFPRRDSTRQAQDSDIRAARDLFLRWLTDHEMTSGD
ncbi:hypothetical protein [Mycobacterium sp. URHB0044]|uniref:hypothetical protein n=1 Tax=Mycobacterium sp. URHB0044 TaxID=1380386 RepID=UPI00048AD7E5|nr:hypothetical protein [Mycobacterium sp. URHB0044]